MGVAQILQITTFILGAAMVVFALRKISRGTSIKQAWPLFLFSTVLLVCGLFGDRLKDLKIGKEGVEFSLSDIKTAAEQAVDKNPELAHHVSKKKGARAVEEAKSMIRNAQSQEDLEKILNVEKSNGEVYISAKDPASRFAYPVRFKNNQIHVESPIAVDQVPSPNSK